MVRSLLAALLLLFLCFGANAQVDYELDNQSPASLRLELNDILEALARNAFSATEPTTTFAGQWWIDSSAAEPVVKIRDASDASWVTVGTVNASTFQLAGTTTFSRSLLDDATASVARTTLGLGALAVLGQVGTAQIADGSVTQSKLASETYSPLSGPDIASGSTAVYLDSNEYAADGAGLEEVIFTWRFVQGGSVTISAEMRRSDSGTPSLKVRKNGVVVGELNATGDSFSEKTTTISVAKGDLIVLQFGAQNSGIQNTRVRNVEIRTDGSPLWPSAQSYINAGQLTTANFN